MFFLPTLLFERSIMMTTHQPHKALFLSIIPGLGQLYNKQRIKGYLFLSITLLFITYLVTIGWSQLWDMFILGYQAGRDNSLFMLIKGAFQLVIVLIFFIFYCLNLSDAYKTACRYQKKLPVITTLSDTIISIKRHGFPYLLIIPAYIAMIFAIIFPVIVTILIAFTNYDFQHLPPQRLLDWVGFNNFLNIWQLSTFRSAFGSVLSWTVIWAICASSLQIAIGIFTAIIANQPFIKGKRIFGVIFLLPWAVPAFISILTFSNMFNDSLGAMNTQVLPFLSKLIPFYDFGLIPWKTDPF